jgi:DNA-binding beta-propeller fold protein YncE
MLTTTTKRLILLFRIGVFATLLGIGNTVGYADSLYIGDQGIQDDITDDVVKRFDADTGRFLGASTPSLNGGQISAPRGLILKGNDLMVVNQNAATPFNGEVLRFNKNNLAYDGALISCHDLNNCDPNSPFVPRGIIRGPSGKLFVADHFGASFDPSTDGNIKVYDINSGKFIGNMDHTGFTDRFYPRGLVIGPDGMLYVSTAGFLPDTAAEGYVLRFNPISGKFIDVFASTKPNAGDCSKHLRRPEGLVFGPDGNLYTVSFRADENDTDKILVFNRSTKQCIDQIDLSKVGEPRMFAQALIFGPHSQLFVPIATTGEVRRYDVRTKSYKTVIPAGGKLTTPVYLIFGETDSKTLEYED